MREAWQKIIRTAAAVFVCLFFAGIGAPAYAESQEDGVSISPLQSALPSDFYYRGKIVALKEEGQKEVDGAPTPYQLIEVQIVNSARRGERVIIENGGSLTIGDYHPYQVGDAVVLAQPNEDSYYIIDAYRLPGLGLVLLIFFILALYWARGKGVTALIGLFVSVGTLFYFIIPHILKGESPLLVVFVGALIILFVSLYVSHGFNKRITVAFVSCLITLVLAIGLDLLFVFVARLSGGGTEEALFLQVSSLNLDLRGVLLAGILIGVLGVLDDVTTAQSGTVEEIARANPSLSFVELYRRGLSVGREHIVSLINTLVLAYAGTAFPLFLLFSLSKQGQPLWVTLNSSFLGEELVRTLVGSSALILAVPITTALAAYFFQKRHA